MAIYLVGDIQGCDSELKALLKQVDFSLDKDTLWPVGDVIARGPDSKKTLKFLYSIKDNVRMVLGNHDLHFLAICAGIKKAKTSDLLDKLIASKHVDSYANWLAEQPLLRQIGDQQAYVSHAGLSPQWSVEQAVKAARKAEKKLASSNVQQWLADMYGEKPDDWHQATSKLDKFRYTINAFTRMRYCYLDGRLEFNCKTSPQSAPTNIKPWYTMQPELKDTSWVIGHWAALMGKTNTSNLHALDTGCVWGGHMTLLRWDDKAVFIEPAHS
ncbi:symmetrical bis(5'-nucleosyl)-tetraphosphatase [Thalassotalea agarivorans]|uniref:bis(5'-nucleosyl)-tetraphosphatase (symmetrical) n=1 Tax=Thalassotalea agarivorans TaxID=349064 RepID=A0A1I0FUW9_THASX|nr:symmetrical bis(5'-nucleosyl)-tetraphosphatase [Thalassotalea agarivorans]SET62038.1 Bis(5'nucleosyl)-tetraphosphatase, ApaH [Thalassotalea agarivorans]